MLSPSPVLPARLLKLKHLPLWFLLFDFRVQPTATIETCHTPSRCVAHLCSGGTGEIKLLNYATQPSVTKD